MDIFALNQKKCRARAFNKSGNISASTLDQKVSSPRSARPHVLLNDESGADLLFSLGGADECKKT